MALRWEMGMEFGMSTGMELESSVSAPAAAPTPTTTTSPPAYMYGLPSADTLLIDDLFDFSNLELFPSSSAAAPISDTHLISPTEPSSTAAAGTRSFTTGDTASCSHLSTTFTDDLYIPCAEAAELEWLSQFVDDSFSDVPYPLSSTGHLLNPLADAGLRADPSSVARRGARKKRSKASAGAAAHHHNHTWSSLAPPPSSSTSSTSSSSSSDFPLQKPRAGSSNKKSGGGEEGGVRRCTHCASEKTPQWRTGPMGPKTLCNACGVRFKSGRLVSEYRPAASPTFVLTQHSNSHRKVMELRRQKEMFHHHDYNPSSAAVDAAAAPQPDQLFHDYEVC